MALMMIPKHDWHDYEGVKYLIEHCADANTPWGRAGRLSINHALARDNSLEIIALLLDHGMDPTRIEDGLTAIARAARTGRSDVLELFAQRGISIELQGVDRLIAACAMGDAAAVHAIAQQEPGLVGEVVAMGGALLAKFTSTHNLPGVRRLLDLGVDVRTPFAAGDGYFDVPKGSLAIHIAAWRAQHAILKFLIERGSPVDLPDANGRTPLTLAVKACVDSYWTERRSPESVVALLRAGASVRGVPYPCGYAEVDALLRSHGATQ
jgi:ankyrin repeat protein